MIELVLVGAVLVAAAVTGRRMWRLARPAPQASDEPSAHEFVWGVLAGLEARGAAGWPEDGTFQVRLADGRALDLQEAWRGYARASGAEAREAALRAALDAWEASGRFRTREAFVQQAAAVVRERGRGVAPDVELGLLEVDDGAVVDLEPVWLRVQGGEVEAEALAAVADDVVALDEAAPLPLVMGRAERALEALRGEAAPAADLGAGLAVRPGLVRGAAIRALPFEPDVLADAVERLAEAGHRFVRTPSGVLGSGFGDARDAGLLLMPEDGFAQVGVRPPVVVWPLTASEVLVVPRGDEAALLKAFDAVVGRIPVLRPLSLVPLVRVEGLRWAPLALPPDHELSEVLRGLVCEQRARDYARVHAAVAAKAAREGLPAPVPLRVEPREGGAVTVATWAGPALIPAEADELEVGERRVPLTEVAASMTARDDLGLPFLEAQDSRRYRAS